MAKVSYKNIFIQLLLINAYFHYIINREIDRNSSLKSIGHHILLKRFEFVNIYHNFKLITNF